MVSEMAEIGKKMFDRIDQLSCTLSTTHITSESRPRQTIYSPTIKEEDIISPSFVHIDPTTARKPGVIPKMWTPEEDLILKSAVEKHGEKNWREIAQEVPERNHLQCLQRWKKALKPGLVKGHWSKKEDDYLLFLMKDYEHGSWNWAEISLKIPGRNAKQCRERWFLNLDPSINRGPWSEEEDKKLMDLHKSFKGRWSLIAKELEGRTENSVKTRFHSLQRREVKERGWITEEDDVFVRGLLVYGRNFVLCARLLPGRTRGQLKKRFPALAKVRPELLGQVQQVEERIAAGHKPTPIHKMLQALHDERKRKTELEEEVQRQAEARASVQMQDQQRTSQTGYAFEPRQTSDYDEGLVMLEDTPSFMGDFKRDHSMKKFQSSWMDDLIEEIADQPEITANSGLARLDSTNVLADILQGDGQDRSSTVKVESNLEPLKSSGVARDGRKKLLPRKHSSLMLLDKLLNNMDEFGDALTTDHSATQPQVGFEGGYSQNTYKGVYSSARRTRRESDGWINFINEDLGMYDGQLFNDKNGDVVYDRGFQSNSWKPSVPELYQRQSFDMPVV